MDGPVAPLSRLRTRLGTWPAWRRAPQRVVIGRVRAGPVRSARLVRSWQALVHVRFQPADAGASVSWSRRWPPQLRRRSAATCLGSPLLLRGGIPDVSIPPSLQIQGGHDVCLARPATVPAPVSTRIAVPTGSERVAPVTAARAGLTGSGRMVVGPPGSRSTGPGGGQAPAPDPAAHRHAFGCFSGSETVRAVGGRGTPTRTPAPAAHGNRPGGDRMAPLPAVRPRARRLELSLSLAIARPW